MRFSECETSLLVLLAKAGDWVHYRPTPYMKRIIKSLKKRGLIRTRKYQIMLAN